MKTKVIATILFILVLVILVPEVIGVAGEGHSDSDCLTSWNTVWIFQESSYCSDVGTYTLYSCQINRWSDFDQEWYITIKHTSTCEYKSWLPTVQKQSSTIGTPICIPPETCEVLK